MASKKPKLEAVVKIEGFEALEKALNQMSVAAGKFGATMSDALSTTKKLATTMDAGGDILLDNCAHKWQPVDTAGMQRCPKCGKVWTPITLIETSPTPAGRLAYEIANMFYVSVSEAEHVVKCVRMNIVPKAQWNTVRNDFNDTTQIGHVSVPKWMVVDHNTLQWIKSVKDNPKPAVIPLPAQTQPKISKWGIQLPKKLKTNPFELYGEEQTAKQIKPVRHEIVETQARRVILPDDDE